MSELQRHGSVLAYGGDYWLEDEPPRPTSSPDTGLLIIDEAQPRPLSEDELDKAMGHIVTSVVVPAQRSAPPEEMVSDSQTPDPSIYLG